MEGRSLFYKSSTINFNLFLFCKQDRIKTVKRDQLGQEPGKPTNQPSYEWEEWVSPGGYRDPHSP